MFGGTEPGMRGADRRTFNMAGQLHAALASMICLAADSAAEGTW